MEVYFALNRTNGKAYAGLTNRTASERFAEHCSDAKKGSQTYFHKALRKYGLEAFDVITVWKGSDLNEAKKVEIRLISGMRLRDDCFGYNLTDGGDGVFGYKPTVEQREKARKAHLGKRPPNLEALHEGNRGNQYALGKRWNRSAEANAKLLGNKQAQLGGHTRWHVNRGVVKEGCELCQ